MFRRERSQRASGGRIHDVIPDVIEVDEPLPKRMSRKLVSLRNDSRNILAICAALSIVMFFSTVGRNDRKRLVSAHLATDDPCKTASPPKEAPRFFDLDVGSGKPLETSSYHVHREVHPRSTVFHTLNEDGFFRHDADCARNTSNSNFDATYDEKVNQGLTLRILREYYTALGVRTAPSLQLRGIWTTFTHVDRWRTQLVLRTRLVKDKTTHPDVPEDITNVPAVAQSNRVVVHRTTAGGCKVAVIPESKDDDRPPIYVVVAYSGTGWGRPQRMSRFILQVEVLQEHPLLLDKQKVILVVALHDMSEEQFRGLMQLEDAYAHSSVVIIEPPVTYGNKIIPFSRGATLRFGVEKSFISEDSLIFLSDIDMHIYPSFFGSCRAGAIRGSQLYFPVPYNLYPGEENIKPGAGFFDLNSTGMACMYKSDFEEARPWRKSYTDSEIKYTGVGREDDDFLDAVARLPNKYRIFRAVDPYLRHAWHMKSCRWNMARRNDCMFDAYKALGVSAHVGRQYLKEKDQDLQRSFRKYDEDWDPKEKAITLKRSESSQYEEPGNPRHGQRWW